MTLPELQQHLEQFWHKPGDAILGIVGISSPIFVGSLIGTVTALSACVLIWFRIYKIFVDNKHTKLVDRKLELELKQLETKEKDG